MKIVTFSCQKTIHVYHENCGLIPNRPCKFHASIDEAKKYMADERNIFDARIVEFENKTISRNYAVSSVAEIAEKAILNYQKS